MRRGSRHGGVYLLFPVSYTVQPGRLTCMDFLEVIKQARAVLQSEGRMTYRTLKRQFALDDEALEDLKEELIYSTPQILDDEGRGLIWNGETETPEETSSPTPDALVSEPPSSAPSAQPEREAAAGERRQLTVMFCDLVGSTALSEQLDPEELQTVVRTYQEVSAQVIERYEGYIAQYLGDGLLVYFGYPAAHEDDAARAIRAGLEIVTALHQARSQFPQPVQVRIGIHTGPVVVGQMGGGSRHEQLALGETPNIAARVQGKAQPDEVVVSAATQRLVAGLFDMEDQGRHDLKGISTPQPLYRVTAESPAQSRFDVAVQEGLTPLAGRERELDVLYERWTLAQAGAGQVVLLSGEPGIGKSRLLQELKDRTSQNGATGIAFQCSPYHQNSALYPLITHVERLLQFAPDDTPQTKLDKLQQTLGRYHSPQPDTVSLFATLLSLPHPAGVPLLTVSPQQQKEQTHAALVAWLVEEVEQQPVYNVWEDLHWADPSTLQVLGLLLTQVPTVRLLAVLTFRPEFVPPWGTYSYLSQLTLSRLDQSHVNVMVERVTGGKTLPEEVVQQIVTKTDGVPLFVEELTKMIIESELVQSVNNHYELTGPLSAFAIPATLHDSLMARLDRLATAKEVAQLGATIGREFPYDLLYALSPLDDITLQHALQQLVDAELVYQTGLPPDAQYNFKHALVQDTAYQSLLKSTRQHLHQQIAQVLEARFAQTVEIQPELLAHHYTHAGLPAQAIPYLQRAGQRAARRSAYAEGLNHLTKGLDLLEGLPDTAERAQQELALLIALGPLLQAIKGNAAPEVERTYARARELCQQVGQTPQLFPVLRGLCSFYAVRGELRTAHELAEQLLTLAQRVQDRPLLLEAHRMLGNLLFFLGELTSARESLEQGMTLYNPQQDGSHAFLYGIDPGVICLSYGAMTVWLLGHPDQALKRIDTALTLAQTRGHPFSLTNALFLVALLHRFRRDGQAVQEQAEALLTLAREQGFPLWEAIGTMLRGWALAEQGHAEEGIVQIRQGLTAYRATGAETGSQCYLALLAEACGKAGQIQEGLGVLAEALSAVNKTEDRWNEAELHRLTGELTLQASVQSQDFRIKEAEECFRRATGIACQQSAKSLELRAVTSLTRLWQQQGKATEARDLLVPVYHWFTEGFDTPDLKDAKALLQELA